MSYMDIEQYQAQGGFMTKVKGIDGASKQLGSTRASLSSHHSIEPYGVRLQRVFRTLALITEHISEASC